MSKVIMTSQQLIERLFILLNSKTFYKNKWNYNLGLVAPSKSTPTFKDSQGRTVTNCNPYNVPARSFDCHNLYKCLLNGYDVNYNAIGYYQTSLSNTGDCSEKGLIDQCGNVTNNFTLLKDGIPELLYMSGHCGGFVGTFTRNGKTYNVIECTPSFGGGVVASWVDSDGTRRAYKGGNSNGRWTLHGLFTPWISYDGSITIDVNNFPILSKGSQGSYVTMLQTLLVQQGYDPNGIDGYFGDGCDKAVRQYQKDHNLEVDGCVGPATWNVLVNGGNVSKPKEQPKKEEPKKEEPKKEASTKVDVSKYPVLKKGSKGKKVTELQNLLRGKGYLIKVDGDFGDQTDGAVRKFQKKFGLEIDGKVGPITWDKLING